MKKTHLKLIVLFLFVTASQSILAQSTAEEKELLKAEAEMHNLAKTDSLKGWKKGGDVALNLTQVNLSNWAAGGQNSMSINGMMNLYAFYRKEGFSWDNMFDLGYGIMNQGNTGFIKTDDKIDLASKFGLKAFDNWHAAGILSFKSQLTPGYSYPNDSVLISNFLAPAYVMASIGMDHKTKMITTFISPITTKITIVNDQTLANDGAFGVNSAIYDNGGNLLSKGSRVRAEMGAYLKLVFDGEIMKNIRLQSKLELFTNYLTNPENIDISWENLLVLKVNKYISANITTHLVYDNDIKVGIDTNGDDVVDYKAPRTQFKEVLGVGFTYKFSDTKPALSPEK